MNSDLITARSEIGSKSFIKEDLEDLSVLKEYEKIVRKIYNGTELTRIEMQEISEAVNDLQDGFGLTLAEVENIAKSLADDSLWLRKTGDLAKDLRKTQSDIARSLKKSKDIGLELVQSASIGELISRRDVDLLSKKLDYQKANLRAISQTLGTTAKELKLQEQISASLSAQEKLRNSIDKQRANSEVAGRIGEIRTPLVGIRTKILRKVGANSKADALEGRREVSQRAAKAVLDRGGSGKDAWKAAKQAREEYKGITKDIRLSTAGTLAFAGAFLAVKAAVSVVSAAIKFNLELLKKMLILPKLLFDELGKVFNRLSGFMRSVWARMMEISGVLANYTMTVGATSNAAAGRQVRAGGQDTIQKFENLNAFAQEIQADPLKIFDTNNVSQVITDMKMLGLSAKEAGNLATYTKASGISVKAYKKSADAIYEKEVLENKLLLTRSQLHKAVLNASNGQLLAAGGNVNKLTEAVAKAAELGQELSDIENIGNNLMNFESSITSQMEAQLLTGKAMDLRAARAYALQGNYAKLGEEIKNQGISVNQYTKWNVLQRKKVAEALGMSREQMDKMMIQQAKAAGLDETKIAALKGMTLEEHRIVSIQDRWNNQIVALKEKFIPIIQQFLPTIFKGLELIQTLATPLARLATNIAKILQPVLVILTEIAERAVTNLSQKFRDWGTVIDASKNRVGNLAESAKIFYEKSISPIFDRISGWVEKNLPRIRTAIQSIGKTLKADITGESQGLLGILVDIGLGLASLNVKALEWISDHLPKIVQSVEEFWKNWSKGRGLEGFLETLRRKVTLLTLALVGTSTALTAVGAGFKFLALRSLIGRVSAGNIMQGTGMPTFSGNASQRRVQRRAWMRSNPSVAGQVAGTGQAAAPSGRLTQRMSSFAKIPWKNFIGVAAILVALGAAFLMLGKGLSYIEKIKWHQILAFTGGMTVALVALGTIGQVGWPAVALIAALGAAFVGFGYALSLAAPAIQIIIDSLKPILEGIGNFIVHIGDQIKAAAEGIGLAFKGPGEGVGAAAEGIGAGFGKAVEGLGNGIGSIIERSKKGTAEILEKGGKGLSAACRGLGEGIGAAAKDIGSGAATVVTALGNAAAKVIGAVSDYRAKVETQKVEKINALNLLFQTAGNIDTSKVLDSIESTFSRLSRTFEKGDWISNVRKVVDVFKAWNFGDVVVENISKVANAFGLLGEKISSIDKENLHNLAASLHNLMLNEGFIGTWNKPEASGPYKAKSGGGIVGAFANGAPAGDTGLAWVNRYEMILNTQEQSALWDTIRNNQQKSNTVERDSKYTEAISALEAKVDRLGQVIAGAVTANTDRQIAAIRDSRPDWDWTRFDQAYAQNVVPATGYYGS